MLSSVGSRDPVLSHTPKPAVYALESQRPIRPKTKKQHFYNRQHGLDGKVEYELYLNLMKKTAIRPPVFASWSASVPMPDKVGHPNRLHSLRPMIARRLSPAPRSTPTRGPACDESSSGKHAARVSPSESRGCSRRRQTPLALRPKGQVLHGSRAPSPPTPMPLASFCE